MAVPDVAYLRFTKNQMLFDNRNQMSAGGLGCKCSKK